MEGGRSFDKLKEMVQSRAKVSEDPWGALTDYPSGRLTLRWSLEIAEQMVHQWGFKIL